MHLQGVGHSSFLLGRLRKAIQAWCSCPQALLFQASAGTFFLAVARVGSVDPFSLAAVKVPIKAATLMLQLVPVVQLAEASSFAQGLAMNLDILPYPAANLAKVLQETFHLNLDLLALHHLAP
jgi:hypothetical protein